MAQPTSNSPVSPADSNGFVLNNIQETLERIAIFYNQFVAAGGTDNIDNAIRLARGLAERLTAETPLFSIPILQPLLLHMRQVRSGLEKPSGMLRLGVKVVKGELVQTPAHDLDYGLDLGYRRLEDLEGLEKAIEQAAKVLEVIPPNHPDRVMWLNNLGNCLYNRYRGLGTLEDLEGAIERASEALEAIPANHPGRAVMLNNLGNFIIRKYNRLGALEDLEKAIGRAAEALGAAPENDPDRAAFLRNLGSSFYAKYERLGALEDLEKAIERAAEALEVTPANHPCRAFMLNNLGSYLYAKYNRFGALEDVEKAIKRTTEALEATPANHLCRAFILNNLGSYLYAKYSRFGALEDVEKAIKRTTEALEATPAKNPFRVTLLHNLSSCLHGRYERLGALVDLEQAIKRNAEALEAAPVNSLGRTVVLSKLGNYLRDRFKRLGALGDLEEAIERTAEALEAAPVNCPGRTVMLSSLGEYFRDRFERLGALGDLEEAIERTAEALEVTPTNDPDRAKRLGDLGRHLGGRYNRLGALEDLEKGIELAVEALGVTLANDPNYAVILSDLGIYLHDRYKRLGALEDLEKAIERATEALEATPVNHPNKAVMLSNLGNFLSDKYNRLGALVDLEQAIERTAEAHEATPANHPARTRILCNLGHRFHDRYRRLGTLEDLEEAIEHTAEALEATPENHPDRAGTLSDLSNYLHNRYSQLGTLGDLEKAIERAAEALQVTPENHPDRADILGDLGNFLYDKYKRLGALVDLEQAIERAAKALELTPENHPNRASRLGNLGNCLNDRYTHLGALEDLENATERITEALVAVKENDPDWARLLNNQGNNLYDWYQRCGTFENLQRATEKYKEALESLHPDPLLQGPLLSNFGTMLTMMLGKFTTSKDIYYALDINLKAWNFNQSPPRLRIPAALHAAKIFSALGVWHESSLLLENAVKLLPKVSPRLLQRDDQQYQLSEFSQLASVAVSTALQAGSEAFHCLSILELGRGIIMGLIIDCRSSLSDLQYLYPDIHGRFNHLRTKIDSVMDNSKDTQKDWRQRQKDIDEQEELLISIRKLPGLAGFQLPPPAEDLMAIAKEGPIITINCTNIRSDAITVTNSTIKVLPLPGLVFNDVKGRMERLNTKLIKGKRGTYPSRNAEAEDLLLWLWNMIVEPVVEELQLHPRTEIDDSNLPHVWWIGVGALSMAPFHAAGDNSPGSTRNTLCRAISSYIPTIKALSYAREKKLRLLSSDSGSTLLLVTMPKTPQNRPLKSVYEEVDIITSVVKEGTTAERLDSPSAAEVLEGLKSCDAAHFACHGMSNGQNPSASHLLFCKDGNLSGTVDELTAGVISSAKMKHAQIAYLSACSTARNDSVELADESIHIASAFQLAGFSHVLATLWESNDKACLQVSSKFYQVLFNGEPVGIDGGHRKVSMAFHQAVRKLRDKNWRQPLLWASFIHTGA